MDPWATEASLVGEKRLEGVELPGNITRAEVLEAASLHLWRATQHRFGTRSITVRPHRTVAGCFCGTGWLATLSGAGWSDWWAGLAGCGCGGAAEVMLPEPVVSMTSVSVSGAVVLSTGYKVFNQRLLVRTDGLAWPCCQRLSVPTTDVGTWSVTYVGGVAVPADGKLAARELAIHTMLHLANRRENRLPPNAARVDRQGISFRLGEGDKTGIQLVDLFVASVNNDRSGFSVTSPDTISAIT